MSHTKQQGGELVTTDRIYSPGVHPSDMNHYENKSGRKVCMLQNRDTFTDAQGTEWTKVKPKTTVIVTADAKAITQQGPVTLPPSTPAPKKT